MRKLRIPLGLAGAVLLVGACAKSSSGKFDRIGPGVGACTQDADCPAGLHCQAQTCVAADGKPPETQAAPIFLRPQTSAHYVFALSPDNDTVAVIDPATLAIRAVRLPREPYDLQVVPGQDAAVIVERAGASVSFLTCDAQACALQSQRTTRHYPAVAVSADGAWALLWTPDPAVPDQGAEGVVGVVDLRGLASGAPVPVVERVAGRRDTNAFFRLDTSGAAQDAVVIGEDGIAVLDLAHLAQQPLPERVALPAEYAAVASRQALASPDGARALLRSYASQDVAVFEVATRQLLRLPMPGTPSDIELSHDGRSALAVLRDTGQVATFPLPDALTDPSRVRVVAATLEAEACPDAGACAVNPGQAALSPDGLRAALFTNAQPSHSFAMLDLGSGAVEPFNGLEKWVDTLGIGPDGQTVLVLHRPNPASTAADSYQRMVDQSEGYSVVSLGAGAAQLKLTGQVPPQEFVFTGDGAHAAVTLRGDASRTYQVDAIDLQTLVTSTLSLASAPQYAGPFASSNALLWITQEHPAGRISFVDAAARQVRTATGYTLNAGISP